MEFLIALAKIMMVNIILSGDNAVVIAMASRCLPPRQQKLAILWGSGGAIVLRILLTIIAVVLLKIPFLQFAGGILLIWIATKLLVEDERCENIDASDSMWAAIKTIIIADIVMSLDNTLAIAAIAGGDYLLLGIGLALSIPLIIFGSKILVVLMARFPVIVYAGAALIAWTAGEMLNADPKVGVHLAFLPHWLLPLAITVAIVGYGYWRQKQRREGEAEEAESDH